MTEEVDGLNQVIETKNEEITEMSEEIDSKDKQLTDQNTTIYQLNVVNDWTFSEVEENEKTIENLTKELEDSKNTYKRAVKEFRHNMNRKIEEGKAT